MSGFFGDMFDFDNSGDLDGFERAADFDFFEEISRDDRADWDYEEDNDDEFCDDVEDDDDSDDGISFRLSIGQNTNESEVPEPADFAGISIPLDLLFARDENKYLVLPDADDGARENKNKIMEIIFDITEDDDVAEAKFVDMLGMYFTGLLTELVRKANCNSFEKCNMLVEAFSAGDIELEYHEDELLKTVQGVSKYQTQMNHAVDNLVPMISERQQMLKKEDSQETVLMLTKNYLKCVERVLAEKYPEKGFAYES